MSISRTISMSLALAAALLAGRPLLARADDHRQYKDAKPEECRECHRASSVMDNHGEFFDREHRFLAQKSDANCSSCHEQSECVDCHKGGSLSRRSGTASTSDNVPSSSTTSTSLSRRGESMPSGHGPDFLSTHAMKAADNPQSCAGCHDSKTFCSDCHQKAKDQNRLGVKPHQPRYIGGGVPDPAWVATHRVEARRNLQSCQACHPAKADCTTSGCHVGLGGR
jgi:hypothetical protein